MSSEGAQNIFISVSSFRKPNIKAQIKHCSAMLGASASNLATSAT
jgi:hypothetical protein